MRADVTGSKLTRWQLPQARLVHLALSKSKFATLREHLRFLGRGNSRPPDLWFPEPQASTYLPQELSDFMDSLHKEFVPTRTPEIAICDDSAELVN